MGERASKVGWYPLSRQRGHQRSTLRLSVAAFSRAHSSALRACQARLKAASELIAAFYSNSTVNGTDLLAGVKVGAALYLRRLRHASPAVQLFLSLLPLDVLPLPLPT